MADLVWERLCDGDIPKLCAQSRPYHKLRVGNIVSVAPLPSQSGVPITLTAIDDTAQTYTPTAASQPAANSCSPSQRYSFLDSNLRLRYSGALVVEPAWLSLLPKVNCHGAGWLYVKGKSLSGMPCTHMSLTPDQWVLSIICSAN